jgi:Na+/melibiose symporter-like transporter
LSGSEKAARLSPFVLGAFVSAALPVGALQLPLAVYLPNYYASHIGLSLAAVGFAFTFVQLAAIAFDPAIGIGMEWTRTNMGRFRPWLAASVPVLMIGTVAIFMAKPGVGTAYLTCWLLVFFLGYSMSLLASTAWGAVLVPDYNERSRLYAWLQFSGLAGAVLLLFLPPLLTNVFHADQEAVMHAMGWFLIVSVPVTAALAIFVAGEPLRPKEATRERFTWRDYAALIVQPSMRRILIANTLLTLGPAMTGALYFFFVCDARGYTPGQANILLFLYLAAGLAGAPFFAHIANRIGKHRALALAAALNVVTQVGLLALPRASMMLMVPAMFVVGFIANCYPLILNAMVADVCDEVRLDIGRDRTALLYSLMTCTIKIGSALPVGITFPILGAIGFNAAEGAVNTPAALRGLELCFVAVPVLVVVLGGLAMWGYRLDRQRHAEIRGRLDARDSAVLAEERFAIENPAAALAPAEPAP